MINNPTAQYYDENYEDYATGWSEDHIHYGLWYEDTKTHEESLINTTKKAVEHLSIQRNDKVLDAGCGTGGSCRYIAQHFECEVYGIVLSNELINAAYQITKKMKHYNKPTIFLMDFLNTGFKDESFSKIYSIESMIHARSKKSYIEEVYRILRKKGKIVIMDYFLLKNKLTKDDEKIYNEWLNGWFLQPAFPLKKFDKLLKKQGFTSIYFEDITPLIRESSILMHQSAENLLPQVHAKVLSGELPASRLHHTLANYRQKECFDRGIIMYGLFAAVKG